ncbi:MAG: hypothetical protein NVSMB62_14120 [Acidobacteriaceae bacterium]
MTIDRNRLLTAAAAFALSLSGAAACAQTASSPMSKPADQPVPQQQAQPAQAPKLPAYLKQGEAPPATDPIPAPTTPTPPADETAMAQPPGTPSETVTPPGSTTPRTWTTDQILTATVHQAWILSGKDEANFFEIVKELAAISAANRNLAVPDTTDAGKKAGAYIRAQAKEDHDQLLYEIVDKAVRMTGTKTSASVTAHPAAGTVDHSVN